MKKTKIVEAKVLYVHFDEENKPTPLKGQSVEIIRFDGTRAQFYENGYASAYLPLLIPGGLVIYNEYKDGIALTEERTASL